MLAQLISLLLFALGVAATSPALFCKCTCLTNSTIIPLPQTKTCNDCNRQFCLDYHLPICNTAKEENVVTTCFQRDSVKDQFVVYVFIIATVGLLAWALVRPIIARRRAGYNTVPG
ncbi:hypothetical protein FPQ18DRAFT_100767 [Pyronema domesticum]|nr:hypothetical protein FPQ18DRAFT_100767 [Pyronema domesticum]